MATEVKAYLQSAIQSVIERWWVKKLVDRATPEQKEYVEKKLVYYCECMNCEGQTRSRLKIVRYLLGQEDTVETETFRQVWEKTLKPAALIRMGQVMSGSVAKVSK